MVWTLAKIASEIGAQLVGNADKVITGVGTLQNAKDTDISFLANTKYRQYLKSTSAGCVIVSSADLAEVNTNALVIDDTYVAYAKAASLLYPDEQPDTGIHSSAVIGQSCHIADSARIAAQVYIGSNVKIGHNVIIGPGCIIENDVEIGADTRLMSNVTLCRKVQIGGRVRIHPGVVIGADGFGIANDNGKWLKIPQVGKVIIGNDVEIGANTTIDRGAIDDTIISDGVKLDNQIQIGHNVFIGEHTVVAGCVGISGSTRIGAHCAIGGGTGIAGHIEITDGVQLTGMSMVTKSILTAGTYSSGIPVEPTREWHRNVIRYRQLDKLNDKLKQLEAKLK
ncbi:MULTISPECIES: UDP-3-O-(3-hydroxymyristoyl)glucosamine N-acyltransferase [unclassified Methylophaga]|uniref:UDP-3-O-(3-hydroxymyristoyl)glucosamine N-acyltransferase n=1 Tax=unclassified Methylophaga TaxID=2629249 RepID=UPI000C93D452|nr:MULTISPECIES: UDP-3-O-(3-hydroxymyristoyl)glucosamine N-acyltransferase [unclassified Methylophaga]MAK67047.1 UDP-3-O-(3-hydroxymyristoyl)glucosamine N-acyltransferase [Methylophaga sp.]MAY18084.1 UDP-3-O-(3-hydroxymyristoyl)glucosamine N-acyltransferase [Methylophaga sp.]HCD03986.1 UDP-3-O-(3-hydroxymyristoyl)glucosamine N-acyltransferase [Methylophaga sp.]